MSSAEQDLIGVVIPAYNARLWLAATLATLLEQRWQHWVCVIVDDGSTDETGELAAGFAAGDDRITLIRQANTGLPAARNVGIAALPDGCRYVAFLDSDDLWQPDTLQLLHAALSRRPDAVGAYGLAEYIDADGQLLNPGLHSRRQRYRRAIHGHRLRDVPPTADASFEVMVAYGPIWPPAVALQRLAEVQAVGGFDPSFPSQEDWDFYLRMSRRGPYVALDRPLASYRRHGANLSSAHALNIVAQQRVRRHAYVSADNSRLQAKQVARAWRYIEARQTAILARQAVREGRRRAWRPAGGFALGALVCGAQLVRPGPPPPSPRLARHTRPATLPDAGLF